MAIPGTDLESGGAAPVAEEHLDGLNQAPLESEEQADAEDDDDGIVESVTVGQQRMVPVAELIKHRKAAKAANAKTAELSARLQQADQIAAQLEEVRPYVQQLRNMTPQAIEQLRTGTAPTRVTEQPADDTEAREVAEDLGLIDAQGALDVARARRVLNRIEKNAESKAQAAIGPVRQQAAAQQVEGLKAQAKAAQDKHGNPFASQESIDLAYRIVPPELATAEGVAPILLLVAAGLDKHSGRMPKSNQPQYADPIYTEPAAGRRAPAALSADERAIAGKVGLSDKQFQTASDALAKASAGGRRGIALE